jgi:hypothetical protein
MPPEGALPASCRNESSCLVMRVPHAGFSSHGSCIGLCWFLFRKGVVGFGVRLRAELA